MKFKTHLIVLFITTVFMSFKVSSTDEVYKADTQKSSIEWVAGKVTGEHRGIVKLGSGTLALEDNNLKWIYFLKTGTT